MEYGDGDDEDGNDDCDYRSRRFLNWSFRQHLHVFHLAHRQCNL